MVRTTALGMTTGIGLLVFGQTVTNPTAEELGNWGAVGVLGALAFWLAVKVIPQLVDGFRSSVKEIADRQHEDSEKINETLRAMTANCAAFQKEQGKS